MIVTQVKGHHHLPYYPYLVGVQLLDRCEGLVVILLGLYEHLYYCYGNNTVSKLTCFFLSQVIVICLAVIHFLLVMFAERIVVNYVLAKFVTPMWKKVTGLSTKENKFLAVDKEMAAERWPPVTSELPIKLKASVTELREPLQTVEIHRKAARETDNSLNSHEMADQAL
jgi:hypothetical protein